MLGTMALAVADEGLSLGEGAEAGGGHGEQRRAVGGFLAVDGYLHGHAKGALEGEAQGGIFADAVAGADQLFSRGRARSAHEGVEVV